MCTHRRCYVSDFRIYSVYSVYSLLSFVQVKEKTVLAYLLKIPEVAGLGVAINIKAQTKNMENSMNTAFFNVMFFAKEEVDSMRAEVASAAALQREGKSQEKLLTELQTKILNGLK